MDIGKTWLPVLTTVGGALALSLWWNIDDGGSRAFTALLAGFLLTRGISKLVFIWNTRHDTDCTNR
jgi:hypothetical protein